MSWHALVPLPRGYGHPMGAQKPKTPGEVPIVRRDHSALCCRHVLVSEEAETAGVTKSAACASLKTCAGRMSGILDQNKPIRLGQSANAVHVGGNSRIVNRKDGFCP